MGKRDTEDLDNTVEQNKKGFRQKPMRNLRREPTQFLKPKNWIISEEMTTTIDDRIKNRNNWFRRITSSVVLLTILGLVVFGDLRPLMTELAREDLISVLLAFFAIGLSVAFYMKANETSSTFYDNTYKFTREVSEILGRIESGFGEKLTNLHENTAELIRRRELLSEKSEMVQSADSDLTEQVAERDRIIHELIQTSTLKEKEKSDVRSQLEAKDAEIRRLTARLGGLKKEYSLIDPADSDEQWTSPLSITVSQGALLVRNVFERFASNFKPGSDPGWSAIRSKWNEFIRYNVSMRELRALQSVGKFTDQTLKLNDRGVLTVLDLITN